MSHDRSSKRNQVIFVASFVAHGVLAAGLHAHASEPRTKTLTKQIDIEFSKPPPPPPPPPEEPEPEPPPPPPPVEQPKPRPVVKQQTARPTVVPQDTPPDTGSSLPVSDEGSLPPAEPGTGIPGPEPVAAPPPPPPPPPPPVIEAKEGANYQNNPRPAYPRLALREGWEGKVVLRVKVTPQGKVAGATVQKTSGRTVLDEAALEIVKTWTFVPATQGGNPIAGTVSVPFEFQLN